MRYYTPPKRVRAARREKWYMTRHPTTRIGGPPSPIPKAERVRVTKERYWKRLAERGQVRLTVIVARGDRELLDQLAREAGGIPRGEMIGRALRAWAVHKDAPAVSGAPPPEEATPPPEAAN